MQQKLQYQDPFQDKLGQVPAVDQERDTQQTLQEQLRLVQSKECLQQTLDALPQMAMVINQKRQLVMANQALLDLLSQTKQVLGKRPGEVLGCVHAGYGEQGCGSTSFCRYCGAFQALMHSVEGQAWQEECRLLRKKGQETEALDLAVCSNPLQIEGHDFFLVYLTDISQDKRKQTLERIFFHDLLNTAGGIQSVLELLQEEVQGQPQAQELTSLALQQAQKVVDEIQAQKQVMAAETGTLQLNQQHVLSQDMLRKLQFNFTYRSENEDKVIELGPGSEPGLMHTDPVLLERVLGNMLKNALEASKPGEKVSLGAQAQNSELIFWVHNPGYIPEDVQMQLFKRSFSTKGKGRGLGTYSIKLLGEDYLGGRVWFESDPEAGTTFYFSLPLE
ncbi:MAG: HAMP domain-containing sensor histidine kinase [Desulfohalobiaceae bacterium]